MTKYTFKQTYPALWISSFLLILFLGVGIIFILFNVFHFDSKPFFVLGVIFFFIVALIIPGRISILLIEISLDDKKVKKKNISNLFFFQKQSEQEVTWSEIRDYTFQPARQFDKFMIRRIGGDTFKLYHNNDDNTKDDFLKFVKDFETKVKEQNSKKEVENKIKMGRTIYETGTGLVIGIFALFVMVGLPILLFINNFKNNLNYPAIAGIYLGAIFYLTMVIIHRTPKKP